ncbi:MAG: hypothetical protein GC134_06510 [Proteobacteria bacterium]|nr:hypothetical protein [Pseudomonadota bacterium]
MKKHLLTYLVCMVAALPAWAAGKSGDIPDGTCLPIPPYKEAFNKHGLQVWQDDIFKTFLQPNKGRFYYEMPAGWSPIGAESTRQEKGKTCVQFPPHQSATFVNTAHFVSATLQVEGVHFPVRAVWRNTLSDTQVKEYLDVIRNGFEQVSSIYPYGVPNSMLGEHTVMITAGIITDEKAPTRNLYPNVGPNASYIYHWPGARMEELLYHAVAHLYNRFRYMYSYRPVAPTLNYVEYQECLASWVESRYVRSDMDRWKRAMHILHIHEGVVLPEVKMGKEVGMFRKLNDMSGPLPINLVRHRPPHMHVKKEYAHYILAPLLLMGAEGLLIEGGKDVRMEDVLRDVHTNKYGTNLYGVLGMYLSEDQMRTYRRWEDGLEVIPRKYIYAALKRYDTGKDPVDYTRVDDLMPKYIAPNR